MDVDHKPVPCIHTSHELNAEKYFVLVVCRTSVCRCQNGNVLPIDGSCTICVLPPFVEISGNLLPFFFFWWNQKQQKVMDKSIVAVKRSAVPFYYTKLNKQLHKHLMNQGFTFEASDRSHHLSLVQINNLGSDLLLASIVKIARCLQVFILTTTFLSITFTRKVSPLYNAVFELQYLELTYHWRCRWRSQPAAPRLQERHRSYAGHVVYKMIK